MTGVDLGTSAGLDLRALERQPSRADVRAYRRRIRQTQPGAIVSAGQRIGSVIGLAIALGLTGFIAWLFGLLVSVLLTTFFLPGARLDDLGSRLAATLVLLVCGGAGVLMVRVLIRMALRDARLSNRWRRRTRLDAFATANGGRYVPAGDAPGFRGTLIPVDAAAAIRDVIEFPRFSAGVARVTTGTSGVRRIGHEWGFVRVRLDRPVPHIVLVSVLSRRTSNRRTSRIPLAESQRLGLEGDFDRSFTVYAPDGYGADTLYVLTPDLMALLVDEVPECDVDFVDDSILLTMPRAFDLADPATVERLERLAERVGDAAVRRTARYADQRPGAIPRVTVARSGRRLRTRLSTARILGMVVFGLVVLRWLLMDQLHLF